MREETVARNYAETLFALAERHEGVEAYQDALAALVGTLNESPGPAKLPGHAAHRRRGQEGGACAPRSRVASRDAFSASCWSRSTSAGRRCSSRSRSATTSLLDEHHKRVHVEVTVARALDGAAQRKRRRPALAAAGPDRDSPLPRPPGNPRRSDGEGGRHRIRRFPETPPGGDAPLAAGGIPGRHCDNQRRRLTPSRHHRTAYGSH